MSPGRHGVSQQYQPLRKKGDTVTLAEGNTFVNQEVYIEKKHRKINFTVLSVTSVTRPKTPNNINYLLMTLGFFEIVTHRHTCFEFY